VKGAVARLAEAAYQRLGDAERRRARPLLLRLAGDDEEGGALVRRRVSLEELELDRDEDTARALAVLTESRLLTVDEGTVEVAHEALLREWPRLRRWLEEDAEGRRLHQHLIAASQEWRGSGSDPAELYRGARLASALDWAAEHDPELNELEREFLEESRVTSEREAERQRRTNRRLRSLLVGVGVLLTVAVVAGLIARSERQSARNSATEEAAQRLGAQALTDDRLDQALRFAGAGAALDDSVATRSNLLSTLVRSPAMLGVLDGDGDSLGPVALSPDGRKLAVGDSNGTVLVFDPATHERVGEYQIPGEVGEVFSLTFSPAGDSLAAGAVTRTPGRTPKLHILDARTLRLQTAISLERHPVTGRDYFPGTVFAPDGQSVIVVYASPEPVPVFLRRFDARSGLPLGEAVRIARRPGTYALLSAPGGRVVYAAGDATYVIDAGTLRVLRRYPVTSGFAAPALSADGRTLALSDGRGPVRLLDLVSGRVRQMRGRQDSPVSSAAFSPDGRRLATGGEDGNVIVWDPRSGRATETLEGHGGAVWGGVFSPDGHTLYTASTDLSVIVWDVAGDRRLGRPFRTGIDEISGDKFPPAFAVSPDGKTVAAARFDGRVDLIDAETLRRTRSFEAFDRTPATAIDYSPNGDLLAVAGGRGLIGIWDAESGERAGPLLDAPRQGPCTDPGSMFEIPRCFEETNQDALAFGPGDLLAAASVGGTVRIWDLGERQPIGPPIRLPHFVVGLDFSPDGSQLAIPFGQHSGGPDGVEVIAVQSRERVARLPADSEVRVVRYSPDGRLLASGLVDGTTQLWATDDWRMVGSPLTVGQSDVLRVEFSPDGRTLSASSGEGTVGLWDVESQTPIASLPGPRDQWVTTRFTPDGSHLFALYDNRRAIRWEVDPAAWRLHACALAGGGLTPEQWEDVVPDQDYVETCPD
jgi:WD40 repeat protein